MNHPGWALPTLQDPEQITMTVVLLSHYILVWIFAW